MPEAAKITIPVTTNASRASMDMDKLDKSIESTGKSAKVASSAVSKFGAVLLGAGVLGAMKKAVSLASNLEEETSKFKTVFRGAGEAAQKNMKILADAYGLGTLEATRLMAATGDILKGVGFTTDAALDFSTQINQLAADVASFSNAQGGAAAVSKAFTSALLGEREAAKTYGVVISEAFVQQELYAKGKEKLTGEALLQAKAEATLAIIYRQTKDAQGDAIRTAGSYANIQRRVANRIQDIAADIGKELLPGLKKLGTAFIEATKDGGVLLTAFKGISSAIGALIGGLGNVISAVGLLSNKLGANINQKALDQMNKSWQEQAAIVKKTYGSYLNLQKAAATGDDKALAKYKEMEKLKLAISLATDEQNKKTQKDIQLREDIFNIISEEQKKLGDAVRAREKEKAATKASKDQLKAYAEALKLAAGSGDIAASIKVQNQAFREQAAAVAAAGGSLKSLTLFQERQRVALIGNALRDAADIEGASLEQRKAILTAKYEEIMAIETLNREQKLEAERVYAEQSAQIEAERWAKINQYAQTGAQVAGGVMDVLQAYSNMRVAMGEKELAEMEAQGASEEAIAQRRKELERENAKRQKKLGIFGAIIDTSTAITRALATVPFPANFVMAALAAAKGAMQIATIKATPLPAAQFGGSFTVPPGATADSGLLRVNQGETATITPVRETGQGAQNMTVSIDGNDFRAYMVDEMNKAMNNGDVQIRRSGAVKIA